MTAVLLFVMGAFVVVAFNPVENDWTDRLDDIGLPLVGLVCLVWYLAGRNRFKRSLVPVVLAGLALTVQLLAVPLERDDSTAFGDNIGGLIIFVPFFIFAVVQYVWNGRRISAGMSEKSARE